MESVGWIAVAALTVVLGLLAFAPMILEARIDELDERERRRRETTKAARGIVESGNCRSVDCSDCMMNDGCRSDPREIALLERATSWLREAGDLA